MHWVEDMLVVLQVLPVCSDCQTPYDAYLGIPFHIANSSLKGVICTSHEVHIASIWNCQRFYHHLGDLSSFIVFWDLTMNLFNMSHFTKQITA